jgi:hypothetical protein
MELRFDCQPELPRLAWCAELCRDSPVVNVLHGPWVETGATAFSEGAWSGDFAALEFTDRFFAGSGGWLREGRLVFACPNHTLDRICSLLSGDRLVVSNSIPLLLARADDELDPDFPYYDSLFVSIKDGLNRYVRSIPTRHGRQIELHYYANLTVTPGLLLEESRRVDVPPFATFESYRSSLQSHIRRLFENAADPARKVRFTPLSTLSTGYDSTASAVLAFEAGCRRGVTVTTSRDEGDDSGAPIGELLGLEVRTVGRLDYLAMDGFPEADFNGGPSEFASFAEVLSGRIITTGYRGDVVWSLDADISEDLAAKDASGTSLTEFRLRTGFINLPVPFIGATRHADIHRISCSASMRPWRIGGRYDRPIPRRIIEDAGVPREMFGMHKRATGIYVPVDGLERSMSPASLADFKGYLAPRWRRSTAVKGCLLRLLKFVTTLNVHARHRADVGARRLSGKSYRLPMVVPHALRLKTYGYAGREAFLFQWGMQKLLERYRAALQMPLDAGEAER